MGRHKRAPNGRFEVIDGMYVDSKGYLTLTAGPYRGMRLHVLVAIAKYGLEKVRKKDTVIHHEDNNKLNPHPDNILLKNVRNHNAISSRQYWYLKNKVWEREKKSWDEYFAEGEKERKKRKKKEKCPF